MTFCESIKGGRVIILAGAGERFFRGRLTSVAAATATLVPFVELPVPVESPLFLTVLKHYRKRSLLPLGPRILRTETAAIIAVTSCQMFCGNLKIQPKYICLQRIDKLFYEH
jgi:hypothetical protein